jgi:hypothetical protein
MDKVKKEVTMLAKKYKNLFKPFLITAILIQLLVIEDVFSAERKAGSGRSANTQTRTSNTVPAMRSAPQNFSSVSRQQTPNTVINTPRSYTVSRAPQTSNFTRSNNPVMPRESASYSVRNTPSISQQSSSHRVSIPGNITVRGPENQPSVSKVPVRNAQVNPTISITTSRNQNITVRNANAPSVRSQEERMVFRPINNRPSNINTNTNEGQRTVTVSRAIERRDTIENPDNRGQITSQRRTEINNNNQPSNVRSFNLPQARAETSRSASISERINPVNQNTRKRQTPIREEHQTNPGQNRQRQPGEGKGTIAVKPNVPQAPIDRAAYNERFNHLRQSIADKQTRIRKMNNENLARLNNRHSEIGQGKPQNIQNSQAAVGAAQAAYPERMQRRTNEINRMNLHISRQNLNYRHGRFSNNVVFFDRSHSHWYWPHHQFWYFNSLDNYRGLYIGPTFSCWIGYRFGNYWSFGYVHPYYHRKYIFVSLDGYCPWDYDYARYYWYGWYPYRWYGYDPVPVEVGSDTYNYYTYNYYSNTDNPPNQIASVDENTFADVRAKLANQANAQPKPATAADTYFDEAVKAFEAGSYISAADKLSRAMALAPEDKVLPFAFAQSLIAIDNYTDAANVLKASLANLDPDKEGVYFPRGLYSSDDVLFAQVDKIEAQANAEPSNGDLQLIAGYELMGIGENEKAFDYLQKAGQNLQDPRSAVVLLEVLDKVNTLDIQESDTIESNQPAANTK